MATSLGLSNRWPLPTKLSRIYSILFLFALLALTACTSNDPPTVATTQPATTNEPTATTATEPGATGPTAAAVIEPTPNTVQIPTSTPSSAPVPTPTTTSVLSELRARQVIRST